MYGRPLSPVSLSFSLSLFGSPTPCATRIFATQLRKFLCGPFSPFSRSHLRLYPRPMRVHARFCVWCACRSVKPTPLDIVVTYTTCPVPRSSLCSLLSALTILNPDFMMPLFSRVHPHAAQRDARRRSRCKLLFASLEEIRLPVRRAPVEAPGPFEGEDKG